MKILKLCLLATVLTIAFTIFVRIRNEERNILRSLFKENDLGFKDIIGAPAPLEDIGFDVLADIQKAKKILADGHPLQREYKIREMWAWANKQHTKKRRWNKKELIGFDVLLAVENIHDRRIKIVRFDGKAKKSATPGFDIILKKENGMNSQFEVRYPQGYLVLAIKRPINMKKGGKQDGIYSPYSEALDVPQVRKRGFEYLRAIIHTAELRLRTTQVHSLVFPDSLVSGMVPSDVAEALVIIEHIDPGRFSSGVPVARLVREVLTVIGLNESDAYKYAISPAHARGMFQFIPPTYRFLLLKYPKAGLIRDFAAGMDDHVNAAMASFLLFDSDLSYANPREQYALLKNPRALGLYLASSYNGGAVRTVKAMAGQGDNWMKSRSLLPETRVYLEKYNSVSGMMQ